MSAEGHVPKMINPGLLPKPLQDVGDRLPAQPGDPNLALLIDRAEQRAGSIAALIELVFEVPCALAEPG